MSERVYEILFIADPNLGEPEVEALAAQVQGFVEKEGGTIQKREMWGKKRLAYVVGRHREGSYVLIVAAGPGSLVKEVERRLKVTDGDLPVPDGAGGRGAAQGGAAQGEAHARRREAQDEARSAGSA